MEHLYNTEKYSLYELIKTEIDNKGTNWSSKEKIDYIYLRMCQIFNYDERWNYSHDEKLKSEIYDYNVNIFNMDTTKLVCSSFSKVFSDLVNIILMDSYNFDIALTEGNISDGHMYTLILFRDGTSSIYDPINRYNDFLNAKVSHKLQGIKMYNNLSDWENELLQESSYRKIGYNDNFLHKLSVIANTNAYANLFGISLLNKMIETIDTSNLGLHEVNNLFNLYSNLLFQKNLNRMGISAKYDNQEHRSRFLYITGGKKQYIEEEIQGKVYFKKIK